MIVSRAYNTFQELPFGRIKKSSNTERMADEINYYKMIQRDENKYVHFPRMIYSQIGTPNWMILEKYNYPTLTDYILNKECANWDRIFTGLFDVLREFEYITDINAKLPNTIQQMYIVKTETELSNLIQQRVDLSHLWTSKYVNVNGNEFLNFYYVWDDIKRFILNTMTRYNSIMIHGDMCFSNILYGSSPTEDIFRFIDPRGSFGIRGIYGDQRYDIAKLYHSVDGGYEFIINDKYEVSNVGSGESYTLKLNNTESKDDALRVFEHVFFDKFNKKEIKIIQGCIFIGMCARHYDSTDRQLAMYLTGIRLLNESMNL